MLDLFRHQHDLKFEGWLRDLEAEVSDAAKHSQHHLAMAGSRNPRQLQNLLGTPVEALAALAELDPADHRQKEEQTGRRRLYGLQMILLSHLGRKTLWLCLLDVIACWHPRQQCSAGLRHVLRRQRWLQQHRFETSAQCQIIQNDVSASDLSFSPILASFDYSLMPDIWPNSYQSLSAIWTRLPPPSLLLLVATHSPSDDTQARIDFPDLNS